MDWAVRCLYRPLKLKGKEFVLQLILEFKCLNKPTYDSLLPQNPILSVLVSEGCRVLGRQTGLWTAGVKV